MKRHISIIASLLFFGLSAPLWSQSILDDDTRPAPTRFGEWDAASDTPVIDVSAAMNDSTLHGKSVIVEGEVFDVCRKKGCWLVVTDGTSQMRVTFKDYGFFVPTDCDGKTVRLQGTVSVEEVPEDLAKHYAEESKSEDPEAISGPQKVITMVAVGVEMEERAAQ